MKKLLAVSLLFVFFFINGVTFFAYPQDLYVFVSPQDLYGTWIGEFSEDEETIIMEFQFTESALIMEMGYMLGGEVLELDEFSVEIIDWKEIGNTDNDTKSNYPNGFLLELSSPLGSNFLKLYISSDKKQLIIPELNEETGEIMIFVRQ